MEERFKLAEEKTKRGKSRREREGGRKRKQEKERWGSVGKGVERKGDCNKKGK